LRLGLERGRDDRPSKLTRRGEPHRRDRADDSDAHDGRGDDQASTSGLHHSV
jgi:hypothetical protein